MVVKGKYNEAVIYAEHVDSATIGQIIEMCNQPFIAGKRIRIMPDTHAGAGCTIGTTMEVKDHIVPNWVGVDISCGMSYVKIPDYLADKINLEKLDHIIRSCVPSGMKVHEEEYEDAWLNEILGMLRCRGNVDVSRAKRSVGTLGGGNHFIELAKSDETGDVYLIVHSGSRHLGLEVANYYQKLAAKKAMRLSPSQKAERNAIIERCKKEGRTSDINAEIAQFKSVNNKYTKGCEPLIGQDAQDYLYDMELIGHFAHLNREMILTTILKGLGLYEDCARMLPDGEYFETVHNYIEVRRNSNGELFGILRKGAISAKDGEQVLIPMNMRDGSLLCVGKGNPEWNYSAPHGAGRILSRSQAKDTLSLEEFRREMQGIYTTSVSSSTLDEAPMVYKSAEAIEKMIGDTVKVKEHLRPLYNFKASE